MGKIIKEIKADKYIYIIEYILSNNKVYPRIEIYKDVNYIGGCNWTNNHSGYFCFSVFFYQYYYGYVNSIKELFIELRKYINIPQDVEIEYEKIFLLYKLNDFKEI